MSSTSWQKTCGEGDECDLESATACHVPMRELEQEFDVVDGSISGWLHDQAAWLDCMSKQGLLKFNNFVDRKAK